MAPPTDPKEIDLQFLNAVAKDFYRLLHLDEDLADKPIDIQVTSDGMRITLFDRARKPLFQGNTAEFTEWGNFVMTAQKGPVSLNPLYKSEEIQAIADRWHRKFYLRPGHMLQMLATVSGPVELWQMARSGMYILTRIFHRAK